MIRAAVFFTVLYGLAVLLGFTMARVTDDRPLWAGHDCDGAAGTISALPRCKLIERN